MKFMFGVSGLGRVISLVALCITFAASYCSAQARNQLPETSGSKVLGEVKLPAAQPTQIDISILRSEPQIRPRRLMKAPRARNLGINRKQDSLYLRPVPAQLRSQPSLDRNSNV